MVVLLCSTIHTYIKREIFAIRNRLINIPYNFSTKCEYKCECGKLEDMQHIYVYNMCTLHIIVCILQASRVASTDFSMGGTRVRWGN